ncbi:MAG TPA: RNA methyltransferase [Thermoplasmata archaeon]|nr:RNA methyltransferase [Thermoplasmata archaeon]
MPRIRVVLVEAKNEGNVGAVARAMRNFAARDLVLVNPCPIGDEAYKRAMHGVEILQAAKSVESFEAAVRGADFLVGTSGIDTRSEKRFARISVTPREAAARVAPLAGTVAIALGREDFGLSEGELARCDLLVTIPAAPDYPILNLSHAATVVLYELFAARAAGRARREASGLEKEKLHEAFAALLEATDYPEHKRARTKIMFRRLMGRAVPSAWEFHALMGVLQRATKRIARLERVR